MQQRGLPGETKWKWVVLFLVVLFSCILVLLDFLLLTPAKIEDLYPAFPSFERQRAVCNSTKSEGVNNIITLLKEEGCYGRLGFLCAATSIAARAAVSDGLKFFKVLDASR